MLGLLAGLDRAAADEVTLEYSFTVSVPGATIPETGYAQPGAVEVQQFDPGGGLTLERVKFELSVDFIGTMQFENLDVDLSTTYLLELSWLVELKPQDEDSTFLVDVAAVRAHQGLVDPYDGILDFGGTSGVTRYATVDDAGDWAETTESADLELFTGSGTVPLDVAASYVFSAAAGDTDNFESQAEDVAFANGELTVTYTYIPEPMPAGLMLLAGFALWRR